MKKNTIHTEKFSFSKTNLKKAQNILQKYPKDKQRSAVMPLLFLAQEQNDGWISIACMSYIAEFLNIPDMHVYEVANFYTMYNKNPIGKHHIQVCRTASCWLRGAADITKACENKLGIKCGETTKDKLFTISEVSLSLLKTIPYP